MDKKEQNFSAAYIKSQILTTQRQRTSLIKHTQSHILEKSLPVGTWYKTDEHYTATTLQVRAGVDQPRTCRPGGLKGWKSHIASERPYMSV